MANSLFDLGRQKFLSGFISWQRDDIKAVLVNTTGAGTPDSINVATDEFLSDITAGARIATSGVFTSKTVTNGIADAADIVFSAVSGDSAEALVIYKDVPSATGTGDSLSAPSSGIQTLTDSAGLFTAGMERGMLKITGAGSGGNNGSFYITKYTSSTVIEIYNPAGASETSSFTWSTESPLIAYIDSATGLAVTPNGGDITVSWQNTDPKIFKL